MRWLDQLRAAVLPFAAGPASHALRLWREPAYRQHAVLQARLAGLPRRWPANVVCDGFRIQAVDAASFLAAHREIFVEEVYRFPFDHQAPSIVDLGANIGLATLWFKRHYPQARIIALEPDPAIFACLTRNVRDNGFSDVELINKAAWNADTKLRFLPDGADGGYAVGGLEVVENGVARGIEVEALAIDRLLADRPIDFLKMDIEGAENVVLAACRPLLPRVRCLFVEYHAHKAAPSLLGGIVSSIEAAGFRLHVESVAARAHPFLRAERPGLFDMQLNLFAWR